MIEDVIKQAGQKEVSTYQPTKDEMERLQNVVRDYRIGYEILYTAYDEFDGTVINSVC